MAFWKKDNRGPKAADREHGLFEVYKPACDLQHDIDIIVIHGLGGSAFGTWTAENQIMWPRDCIPKVIPSGRVMTFGYDSKYAFSPSKADIEDFARELLNFIRIRRWSIEAMRKPLVFICHSLGGIVCKKALILAQKEPFYSNIFESTREIAFFGCPHRGSRVASWATTMGNFINTCSFMKPIREDLLQDLTLSSRVLADISVDFKGIVSNITVKTFYETRIMSPLKGLVVEKDSAILEIDNERRIPLPSDHRDMVRFAGVDDPKFEHVLFMLKELQEGQPIVSLSPTRSPLYLLKELAVTVYSEQFETIPNRAAGTCDWISSVSTFRTWLTDGNSSILLLCGFPGVGKSVITKYLVQNVIPAFWIQDSDTGTVIQERCVEKNKFLAYFFCSNRSRDSKTEGSVLRSVLHQLINADPGALAALQPFHRDFGPAYTFLHDSSQLLEAIASVIAAATWEIVYVVLDAFDELDQNRLQAFAGELQAKFRELGQRISPRAIKVLITLRPNNALERVLGGEMIEVNTEGDIKNYLKAQIEAEAMHTQLSKQRQSQIFETLSQKAGTMFLWADLGWERFRGGLRDGRDFNSCFSELLSLPPRLESMFEDILGRYSPKSLSTLVETFKWIAGATRALHIDELRFAVALSHNRSGSFQQILSNMPSKTEIQALCPSLICFDRNGFVQFVHTSVKDYLTSGMAVTAFRIDPIHNNAELALLSLQSLILEGFGAKEIHSRLCDYQKGSEVSALALQHHLLFYACCNWPEHVQIASDSIATWGSACQSFFRNEDMIRLWLMLYLYDGSESAKFAWPDSRTYWLKEIPWNASSEDEHYGKPMPPAVHIAVYLRNKQLLTSLVNAGHDVNARNVRWRNADSRYYRPELPLGGSVLHFQNLDPDMVDCLFRLGADAYAKDGSGRTSVSYAFEQKNEELVSRIYQSSQGQKPTKVLEPSLLYQAISSSMKRLLQELLDNNELHLDARKCLMTVNTPIGWVEATPLEYASFFGMESMANIMLSHSRTLTIQSTIERLVERGKKLSLAIITALQGWPDLTLKALDIYSANPVYDHDMNGRTVLHHAVMEEWHDVFESCVKSFPSAKLDIPDKNGMTAMHHAARTRNWYAAKRLLEAGVDWQLRDHRGRTPAHIAGEEGSERVLNIMIEARAIDVHAEDEKRRRVLHYVAMRGFYDIAETLLGSDSVPGARDVDGRTAALVAALFGSTAILSLLISTGCADVNDADYYGNTMLHLAVEGGSENCVDEVLWKEGVHRNAINRYGKSPLDVVHYIREPASRDYIAELLRDAGVLPGHYRPRNPYVHEAHGANAVVIPDKYANGEAWAIVTREMFNDDSAMDTD